MQRPTVATAGGAASRSARVGLATHADFPRTAVVVPVLIVVPLLIVLLLVRRASGALSQPLPALALFACGSILAAWAVLLRDSLAKGSAPNRGDRWTVWLPAAALSVACWTLLLPGSSPLGTLGLIGILGAEEGATWVLRRRTGRLSRPGHADMQTKNTPARAEIAASDSREEVIAEMVRRREPDGCEAIRGWTRVELAAGQRTAPVHVAFCPALAGMPHCEAEQSAGPAASVRVAQVLPYGARFEVKLDQPAPEVVTVEIEFSAIASADITAPE